MEGIYSILTNLIFGLPVDNNNLNSLPKNPSLSASQLSSLKSRLRASVAKKLTSPTTDFKNGSLIGGLLGGSKEKNLLGGILGDENQVGLLIKILGDSDSDGLLSKLLGGSESGKKGLLSNLVSTKEESLVGGLLGTKNNQGLLNSVLGNGKKNTEEGPGLLSSIPIAGPVLQGLAIDSILNVLGF